MERKLHSHSNTNFDTTSLWWLLQMTDQEKSVPRSEEHSILVLHFKRGKVSVQEQKHQVQMMGLDCLT